MYIYKFQPILKSTIWGGEKIVPYKGIESDVVKVGESWELSGVKGNESVVANGPEAGTTLPQLIEKHGAALVGQANYDTFGNEFPLLIKFIDAQDDLSIQVHPDDKLAMERHGTRGKTEMWYVVDAADNAHLRSGFATQVTPEEYAASVDNDTITDLLKRYNVKTGDVFFLPAGRIHSIGAGSFIAEIQETSDITYRIYDFNRRDANGNARELHTDLAKGAIDYTVLDDYRTHYTRQSDSPVTLVACPYFTTDLYELTKEQTLDVSSIDSFIVVMCIGGNGTISDNHGNTIDIRQGQTVLVAAATDCLTLRPAENGMKLLTARI